MDKPAFPEKKRIYKSGYATQEYDEVGGMSLRDYFAAKHMQALTSTDFYMEGNLMPAEVAQHAYEMADSMLTEREKR